METMLKFNRLKILSDDANIITAAIRNSESGLMEVSVSLSSLCILYSFDHKYLIFHKCVLF